MEKYNKILIGIFLAGFGLLNNEAWAQSSLFIFYDTECPICQKSSKRLQEMYVKFGQNVAFKAVFPTKSIKKSAIRQFNKEYSFTIPYVIDKNHTLVERYDAKTTPEVVLLDKNGVEVYRGAIDNQFFGLGKYRPKTTEFYLQDALEALAAHRPVSPNRTEAVGCLINRKKRESASQSL
ncbi:redoxin domain-containing protein [Runella salmonicolor]|uniref:Thioredoxin fold domain-containing protein n=1 Tax=Runella salmonicolor TaxID=2950278 RepID=A0ABT1FUV6_9BACT|nr:redoxin domain-containing protein [Runella salmonicolor]MCP1385534.1 thioredoxin fold domain-containing protein [Runella salmonicolor]